MELWFVMPEPQDPSLAFAGSTILIYGLYQTQFKYKDGPTVSLVQFKTGLRRFFLELWPPQSKDMFITLEPIGLLLFDFVVLFRAHC
jgi:hypothetical protein